MHACFVKCRNNVFCPILLHVVVSTCCAQLQAADVPWVSLLGDLVAVALLGFGTCT